jgi:hypothetical protein
MPGCHGLIVFDKVDDSFVLLSGLDLCLKTDEENWNESCWNWREKNPWPFIVPGI